MRSQIQACAQDTESLRKGRENRRSRTRFGVAVGFCGLSLGLRDGDEAAVQSSRSSSSHSTRPTAPPSLWILADNAPGSLLLSIISSALIMPRW